MKKLLSIALLIISISIHGMEPEEEFPIVEEKNLAEETLCTLKESLHLGYPFIQERCIEMSGLHASRLMYIGIVASSSRDGRDPDKTVCQIIYDKVKNHYSGILHTVHGIEGPKAIPEPYAQEFYEIMKAKADQYPAEGRTMSHPIY